MTRRTMRIRCVAGIFLLLLGMGLSFVVPTPFMFVGPPVALIGGGICGWHWDRAFGRDSHDEY